MNKLNQLIYFIKEELSFSFSICLGVFLFVIFFEPFTLQNFDFNNKMIFVTGISAIFFFFITINRVAIRLLAYREPINKNDRLFIYYIAELVVFSLTSTAIAFYLRFVGNVDITFFIMFKIVLTCIFVFTALKVNEVIKDLKKQNELLKKEKEVNSLKLEQCEEDLQNITVELSSDNYNEKITFTITDIVFIKSADNYVEITYKDEDILKKRLIRNTLKSIEHQLIHYSNFIRCHRMCIVNINYIDRLIKSLNNHWITIKKSGEKLPVSRQYLLKLKEIL